jgi:membrane-associated phospholipid phosphatase
MLFLTDFADLGLVLPLAGMVTLALVLVGRRLEAVAWSLAVTGTLATMLLLKVLVFAWAKPGIEEGLGNPSGHTAAGVVVYAGLVTLIGERFASRASVALVAGSIFGLLFGLTRLMLRVHTLADVLLGGAVGLAGVLFLARVVGSRRSGAPASGLVIVVTIALFGVLAFHGHRLHAEMELRQIAAKIRSGM